MNSVHCGGGEGRLDYVQNLMIAVGCIMGGRVWWGGKVCMHKIVSLRAHTCVIH